MTGLGTKVIKLPRLLISKPSSEIIAYSKKLDAQKLVCDSPCVEIPSCHDVPLRHLKHIIAS
jgi:hypothetical protein